MSAEDQRRETTTTEEHKRRQPARRTKTDKLIDRVAAPIAAAWNKAVCSIFKVGRLLVEARDKLDDENFAVLIGRHRSGCRLPFSWSTAYKLMKIAEHHGLQSLLAHAPTKLPPYWATLHEMSLFSEEEFAYAVEHDLFRSDMKRTDIVTLQALVRRRLSGRGPLGRLRPLAKAESPVQMPTPVVQVPLTGPQLRVVGGTHVKRDFIWIYHTPKPSAPEPQAAFELIEHLKQYTLHRCYPGLPYGTIDRLIELLSDGPVDAEAAA